MILKTLAVGPIAANCYIVGAESSKEGLIIDPGDDPEDILKTVKELGLKIKLIVLTHRHPDHVGGAKVVKEATKAPLAIHAEDAPALQESPGFFFGQYQTPPAPDRLLQDGDSVDIGDLHFKVIHTPGHSPGGICLFGHGLLFSGDTLFNFGIGRYDLPDGDYRKLMDSLQIKLMALPDDTIVYPGHGPETTIGRERRANPFLRG